MSKKSMINNTHVEGILYQHNLEIKTTGENSKNPGTEYITGTIDIATDNDMVNIVPIHFTYCTATTSKGKVNDTYNVLKNIINKIYKTYMEYGEEAATKIRVDSAIGLNEFYSDRSGTEELVSAKRNEGGFIHTVQTLEDEGRRNRFDVDILITGFRVIDADEEKNTPEKGIIKGAIFSFRKELLPVEFSVTDPKAIAYFEDLGANEKNPVFTRIKGAQISQSIVKKVEEESAFGAPDVREYKSVKKDFVVDWASPTPYEWDSEESLTANELQEMISAREIYLAELKKRNDDYKATKGNAIGGASAPTTAAAPVATGTFNF